MATAAEIRDRREAEEWRRWPDHHVNRSLSHCGAARQPGPTYLTSPESNVVDLFMEDIAERSTAINCDEFNRTPNNCSA